MSFVPLKLFLPEMLPSYPSVPATLQGALVTVGIGLLVGLGTKVCPYLISRSFRDALR